MFKISPIQDKKTQEEYAKACGTTFRPDFFAYSMINQDDNTLMGFAQFEINERGGYIKDLKPRLGYTDFEAMFILGRATMNFIDLMGKHTCYMDVTAADEILAKAIGFKLIQNEYFADMNGMFDGHCGNHSDK